MPQDFRQITWNAEIEASCRRLVRLAVQEDLDRFHDWTTAALVDEAAYGAAQIVARQPGVAIGGEPLQVAIDEMELAATLELFVEPAQPFASQTPLARLEGNVRDLLTGERILLNLWGRLLGIAAQTQEYVRRVADLGTAIYDTRKTTPGWRLLEKYATRCGGAHNHRTGLYDAVLIKDNHLAQMASRKASLRAAEDSAMLGVSPAKAVARAKRFLVVQSQQTNQPHLAEMIVEIEVDTLDQLRSALSAGPDIVLLDNMALDQLRDAVAMRRSLSPETALEASGGVSSETVREIAETGVDRISVGGLTHAACWLDIGLDWLDPHVPLP